MTLAITLAAVEPELADAFDRHCGGLPGVGVHRGSILDLAVDAVVSPANSFGFMDGGLDHRLSHHFGWHVQDRVQAAIRDRHRGELVVGHADVVDTDHPRVLFLVCAPTMRVPMVLPDDTVNPYLAARAALLLVRYGTMPGGVCAGEPVAECVKSVAFPGLGTGVGRVGPNVCARQIRAAIEDTLGPGPAPFPRTWAEASLRHQRLYTDRPRNLQLG